jgi:hypothetical protein
MQLQAPNLGPGPILGGPLCKILVLDLRNVA